MASQVGVPATERAVSPTLPGWTAAASPAIPAWAARLLRPWPYALIAAVGLASRLRYALTGYHETFGSGDAHMVLAKALSFEQGDLRPDSSLGFASDLFASPPLVPMLLGWFARVTSIPVEEAPLVLGPLLTICALLALYAIAARAFDRTTALVGVALVALLPRFSFDSTEPDKVAYVLSFFLLALFCLYEGQRRRPLLLVAGAFMGLSVFSHTTAYLFVPVYVLSHLALSRGQVRRMLSPYFLASCGIIVAFFAAYAVLDDHYGPGSVASPAGVPAPADAIAPPAGSPAPGGVSAPFIAPDASHRFVPGVVEEYWDNVTRLARHGFQDSAGDLYLDGIRGQILDPVYLAAIAGFCVAAAFALSRRKFEAVPLLLWMVVVTAGFAIQYPAASHTSRYPSYVTPVFVLMAAFFAVWAGRQIAGRIGAPGALALALAAPFVAYAAFSYATAPDPGLRRLYEGHREVAEYVADNELLTDDAQLLYLGWPSFTFYLAEDVGQAGRLHSFGWQPVSLARYDAHFMERNHIRYYAYDDLTDDYYGSAAKVLANLQRDFELREAFTFCTAASEGATAEGESCAGHVTLYELGARKAETPAGAITP